MNQLSLWRRVVFVDWHGVLSRDPFWMSIRKSATHPLRVQLESNLTEVFSGETVNEWMKGMLSSEQIIAAMEIQLDRRFRMDFMARRLDIDCSRMRVNVELFEVLRKVKPRTVVVLATDNMDCFARTFGYVRQRARRLTQGSETLADWAIICDDIICSSEVGALKSEDPVKFFGPWLSDHGLQFTDALLVDDRADNCAAFAGQGGAAIQWKMTSDDIREIAGSLNHWLDTSQPRLATP